MIVEMPPRQEILEIRLREKGESCRTCGNDQLKTMMYDSKGNAYCDLKCKDNYNDSTKEK